MMKKVLLTGASHGLGRSALDFLMANDITVVAVARHVDHLQHLASEQVQVRSVDLSAMTQIQANELVKGCDTVWHCAALSSPWGVYDDFYAINVEATERLANAAVLEQVRTFVHISTPSVYFDYSHRRGVSETDLSQQFANAYVKTKYSAEQVIRQVTQDGDHQTQFTMLRPRAIFGEYDRVLIPRLLQLHQQGRGVLKLPRGGNVLMDLTYVGNVVEAMRLASINNNTEIANCSVFNITNQEPWLLKDVLNNLFHSLNQTLTIKTIPYTIAKTVASIAEDWSYISHKEPQLTRYSIGALSFDMVLDNTCAQTVLGYRPLVGMQEGIVRTAAAFKDKL